VNSAEFVELEVIGAGGTLVSPAYQLRDVRAKLGGSCTNLEIVQVLTKPMGLADEFYGNIGETCSVRSQVLRSTSTPCASTPPDPASADEPWRRRRELWSWEVGGSYQAFATGYAQMAQFLTLVRFKRPVVFIIVTSATPES